MFRSLSLSRIPDSVKKRFIKREYCDYSSDTFLLKDKQIKHNTWEEDHHSGRICYNSTQLIDLDENEFNEIVKFKSDYFETLAKGKIQEMVIEELVEARFQSI